jgi:hypothetical protein
MAGKLDIKEREMPLGKQSKKPDEENPCSNLMKVITTSGFGMVVLNLA